MERKTTPVNKAKNAQSREDRLKSALKANMARRKAQAKARAGQVEAVSAGTKQAERPSEEES